MTHIPMASRVSVQYYITMSFELGQGFSLHLPGVDVQMPPLGFTDAQDGVMYNDLQASVLYLGSNYAGHLHFNAEPKWMNQTRYSYLTHPTWSRTQCDPSSDVADNWTVRYVGVTYSPDVVYQQELVERVANKNANGVCVYKQW